MGFASDTNSIIIICFQVHIDLFPSLWIAFVLTEVASPMLIRSCHVNTLRPRRNDRRFADNSFKRILLNENFRISIKISLKFVPKGPINNKPALFQIMAWRRSGDKPLSELMMVSLLTHICVTRPQWVDEVGDPVIVASSTVLEPGRRRTITLTNADALSGGPVGTHFGEILIKNQIFFIKCVCNCSLQNGVRFITTSACN